MPGIVERGGRDRGGGLVDVALTADGPGIREMTAAASVLLEPLVEGPDRPLPDEVTQIPKDAGQRTVRPQTGGGRGG